MKSLKLIILIILLIGCSETKNHPNQFSSLSDTLIIHSHKHKGTGLFNVGAGAATFKDTSDLKSMEDFYFYPDYRVIYPENMEDLKLGFQIIAFDSLRYFNETLDNTKYQNINSLADRQILMITGRINDTEVFMVDDNHNQDFRDDSIRIMKDWDWYSEENLILCNYNLDLENQTVKDSGWFRIGNYYDRMLHSASQHLLADLSIDEKRFKIGIADYNAVSFDFYRPVLALLESDEMIRDTLLKRDIIYPGEYLKLGKHHYKFHDLYNGSGTIVLTKEERFDTLVGTQVGMLAPDFKCLSIQGDTLKMNDLIKGKPLLLANYSGCTSRSYNIFKKLNSECEESFQIIGLEHGINKIMDGTHVDIKLEYNKDIYEKYRKAYSSYDCYLIGTGGRILDKFDIFDWEEYLSDYKSES